MDYVLGGVAALITGNVTPNRPKLLKRALTPTKHQPSPNVTPKSEFVEDRSIFLSPTMQKKKAIVKKSPKRIFQNPDLETTDNEEGNSSLVSPKADKVKKHLKDDLDADNAVNKSLTPQKSPKKKIKNKKESITQENDKSESEQRSNENTPKKKKRKHISESESTEKVVNIQSTENVSTEDVVSPKKMKQIRKSVVDTEGDKENHASETTTETPAPTTNAKSPKKQKLNNPNIAEDKETAESANTTKKKNKRRKKKSKAVTEANPAEKESNTKDNKSEVTNKDNLQKENQGTPKKKNKRKKSKGKNNNIEIKENKLEVKENAEKPVEQDDDDDDLENQESSIVNPNAITDKESDSEHESDDEIESENEETNKKVFESEKPDESSDDEEEKDTVKDQKEVKKKEVNKKEEGNTEDEIKRTLFVGNVPFSGKCKKEIKKIFSKHGQIETIRIRTVPIKDGRYTPKLAVIKNELHPERTTVNVYVKYADAESVEKALAENNTLLNEHHLRVSRSDTTGAEHDPRCSVFIGNLPFAMEDEALRAKFENCGTIQSVRIIRDKKTNAGKGFGYVNFESKDGVELALALTEEDLTVKNRILRVKRCTQSTDKKKQPYNQQRGQGNYQDRPQRGGFRPGQGRGGRISQGNRQRSGFGPPGNQQRGRFNSEGQGNQQRGRFNSGGDQGNQRGRFNSRGDPENQRGGFKKFDNQRNQGQQDEEGREGAFRRIMHKRKNQEGNGLSDGPPNKRPNIDQPNKEKKVRKEFVGMTAEKKKKHKFDKGQKKKKALSEILTK